MHQVMGGPEDHICQVIGGHEDPHMSGGDAYMSVTPVLDHSV